MNHSKNSRTKYSALNAISAMALTMTNGLFGIVVTWLVIGHYGSDFNGLNSTANQIVNVLLILEGGFTLASNVALFEPIRKENYTVSNGVLRATRTKFRKIGLLFFVIGTIVAIIYSFAAKTQLSKEFVFTVIMMAVVPQAFNLFYTTTFRVLLQTQQKEYIISGFTALTIGLGHVTNIVLILNNGQMWMVRFVTMLFAIVNCLLITTYTKRKNPFLDFSVAPSPELIKGTGDVMVQKITGVIYTSWPIVFLSISPSGGTLLASVYAVYNNVFVMIKAMLHGVIDAPRLSFGQLLTEKENKDIWPVFKEYEYVAVFFTFIMMTTACALILPFVRIYTSDVTDINYYDLRIAVMMVLIGTIEMLHIPSGHIINMSGRFKVSKNFQMIACVLLIVSMTVLGAKFGVYGMLSSLLLVAFLLAVLEIGYVHTRFFDNKLREFLALLFPFVSLGAICSGIELYVAQGHDGVLAFVAMGIVFLVLNTAFALIIGVAFSRRETEKLFVRGKNLVSRFKN